MFLVFSVYKKVNFLKVYISLLFQSLVLLYRRRFCFIIRPLCQKYSLAYSMLFMSDSVVLREKIFIDEGQKIEINEINLAPTYSTLTELM